MDISLSTKFKSSPLSYKNPLDINKYLYWQENSCNKSFR